MKLPIVDICATGARIEELRIASGATVSELADEMGVSIQAVYHWQYGMSLPSLDNMVVLAAFFGVTIDEILVTV